MVKDKSEGCFFFSKKAAPSEKTKDLLLEEAKKQFCEKGYEGTSVRDICDAAGANVSAIKYYFGGKEGIYRECFLHYGEERLKQSEKILIKSNSIEELKLRVKIFAEDFINEGLENSHITKMICREIEIENPLIQDIFQSTFLKSYAIFADLFIDAQEKGLIRSDVDPHIVTSLLFHSITTSLRVDHVGEKYYGRTLRNKEYKELFINNLITITFDGIKNQEQ
ncbi:MAG: TetR family transcriptional regulator [Bdellovibrionales bacterium]|nr:TetR family transcriptional regulator [Bdellovibrionales bacterium]